MRKRVEDLFLERLEYYKEGLRKPRQTKNYKKVVELIERLKEQYSSAAKLYKVEVNPEKGKSAAVHKLVAIDINWKKM